MVMRVMLGNLLKASVVWVARGGVGGGGDDKRASSSNRLTLVCNIAVSNH